jgi:hypothetical protein
MDMAHAMNVGDVIGVGNSERTLFEFCARPDYDHPRVFAPPLETFGCPIEWNSGHCVAELLIPTNLFTLIPLF